MRSARTTLSGPSNLCLRPLRTWMQEISLGRVGSPATSIPRMPKGRLGLPSRPQAVAQVAFGHRSVLGTPDPTISVMWALRRLFHSYNSFNQKGRAIAKKLLLTSRRIRTHLSLKEAAKSHARI
jgi:hypothetical protein